MDRRWVIVAVSILAAASAGVLAFAGAEMGLWGLTLAHLAFGALSMPVYALCVAHANDFVDRSELVGLAAGLLMAFAIGQVIGPLAAGTVMDVLGPGGLFGFIGVVMAGFGLFTAWRLRVGRKPDPAQVDPFVNTPRTTFVATGLDPRAEPMFDDASDGAGPDRADPRSAV